VPSELVAAQTKALTDVVAAAVQAVRGEEDEVLRLVQTGASRNALARLAKLRAAVQRLQGVVDENGKVWLRQAMPLAYTEGGVAAVTTIGAGDEFAWTQPHVEALQRMIGGAYDDLLHASQEAGRTSAGFAERVRRAVAGLPAQLIAQRTPGQAGRQIARELADGGLTGVVYKDGSRFGVDHYVGMVARTNTALAYNDASFLEYQDAGVKYLEVFDGPSCGWRSHDDSDKADGTVRPIDDCIAFSIAHPNCQRAFGARLDVASKSEARQAVSLRTDAQRADAAAVEQQQLTAAATRAQTRVSARSVAAVQARHARRSA
jgi:hypothetical protein